MNDVFISILLVAGVYVGLMAIAILLVRLFFPFFTKEQLEKRKMITVKTVRTIQLR
jgi:hypothetical protein